MNDLVSIITPCYNNAAFIAQTIDSVFAQTYPYWEMIIVDDGSNDNSKQIIDDYAAQDKRLKIIKLAKNTGTAQARNKAIKIAKGRYIAFLDADDLWISHKLKQQLKFMDVHNLGFTYASYQLIDANNNILGVYKTPPNINYYDLLKGSVIGCSSAIYDTQILGKVYFPINEIEDYVLWLRILKTIKTAKGIQKPLAIYRINPQSRSANKLKAAIGQWQIYRQNERLNLLKSWYYFVHYAYNGWKKYKKI